MLGENCEVIDKHIRNLLVRRTKRAVNKQVFMAIPRILKSEKRQSLESCHTLAGMYLNTSQRTYLFVIMLNARVESLGVLLAAGLHQILQRHEHAQLFSDSKKRVFSEQKHPSEHDRVDDVRPIDKGTTALKSITHCLLFQLAQLHADSYRGRGARYLSSVPVLVAVAIAAVRHNGGRLVGRLGNDSTSGRRGLGGQALGGGSWALGCAVQVGRLFAGVGVSHQWDDRCRVCNGRVAVDGAVLDAEDTPLAGVVHQLVQCPLQAQA